MRRKLVLLIVAATAAAVSVSIPGAFGGTAATTQAPGVTTRSVTIGGTFPISGPAALYAPIAKGMQLGCCRASVSKKPDASRTSIDSSKRCDPQGADSRCCAAGPPNLRDTRWLDLNSPSSDTSRRLPKALGQFPVADDLHQDGHRYLPAAIASTLHNTPEHHRAARAQRRSTR